MNETFLLLPKAQLEILEAWEWYEDKEPGLGDRFKQEVYAKITQVVKYPLVYEVKGKYRETQIDVFPYLIVFDFDRKNDIIIIVSVFHMSRDPKTKY